jgi:hypothetical protein
MASISISTVIFVVYALLSSSSIGGYPNERLIYAISEQSNNNQSSISVLNKTGLSKCGKLIQLDQNFNQSRTDTDH